MKSVLIFMFTVGLSFNLFAQSDVLLSLNGAALGDGCGYLKVSEYKSDRITFSLEEADERNSWKLDVNYPENIEVYRQKNKVQVISYVEEWQKSMPPGPGREAGFKSRYTLNIGHVNGKVDWFTLELEDYDPRTKSWGPFFDIRLNLDNYIHCQNQN